MTEDFGQYVFTESGEIKIEPPAYGYNAEDPEFEELVRANAVNIQTRLPKRYALAVSRLIERLPALSEQPEGLPTGFWLGVDDIEATVTLQGNSDFSLSRYDISVLQAAYTYILSCYDDENSENQRGFFLPTIYNILTSKTGHATSGTLADIEQSIDKLRFVRIHLEPAQTQKNVPENTEIDGYLLPLTKWTGRPNVKLNGQYIDKPTVFYELLYSVDGLPAAAPLLYHARTAGRVVFPAAETMRVRGHAHRRTVVIRDYLKRELHRISGTAAAKRAKPGNSFSGSVFFASIYEHLNTEAEPFDAESKKAKIKVQKETEELLEELQKNGSILKYELIRKDGTAWTGGPGKAGFRIWIRKS